MTRGRDGGTDARIYTDIIGLASARIARGRLISLSFGIEFRNTARSKPADMMADLI